MFINRVISLAIVGLMGACAPMVPAVFAAEDMDFDAFQRELDEIEAQIKAYAKQADEAAMERRSSQPVTSPVLTIPQPTYEPPRSQSTPAASSRQPVRKSSTQPTQGFVEEKIEVTQPEAQYEEIPAEDDYISRTRVSGNYRMAFGVGNHRSFSFNDSNSDLQDRDFHYLFGPDRYNTYDPMIFSRYELDIESDLSNNVSFYTQVGVDPWSYTAISPEITVPNVDGSDSFTFRQKYWGANNSTLPQSIRSHNKNLIDIIEIEADNDNSQGFIAPGHPDFLTSYVVPPSDLDFEFRPLRKAWFDIKGDIWHARIFGLADQNQVMTTDDPLGLSNTKDQWQHSAWLDEWKPIQVFSDRSIRRGHYSDEEAFQAKDSSGRYLTLLRGAAMEADFGRTYVGAMIASRYGLWDRYQDFNNIPGVIRIKHQMTPQWMVGSVYTYRVGLIDREPDAYNQVLSFDTEYQLTPQQRVYAQMAGSRNEIDRLSGFRLNNSDVRSDHEGQAFRFGLEGTHGSKLTAVTNYSVDFAWMDREFRPTLSKYSALRDDEFWGNYGTFAEVSPDVEPFKIGTGLDRGRYVGRVHVKSDFPQAGIYNLVDWRHVRDTKSNSFVENVVRDELTYQVNPHWKLKGFTRWHQLPDTESQVEPFLGGLVTYGVTDPGAPDETLQNVDIRAGEDPSRFTIGGGVEFKPRKEWTFQGFYTRTNDIPDFPRGLFNDDFVDASVPDSEDSHFLLDRTRNFLYNQRFFGLPPYDYFSIIKERVTYAPTDDLSFTFHAAQNAYTLWGPVDENVNHQGVSMDYRIDDKWSLFMDYTHSQVADLTRLSNTINDDHPELNIENHNNIYAHLVYKINKSTQLNMEYGVFGKSLYDGSLANPISPYAVTTFYLPTIDTEHLFRMSLTGDF